MTLSAAQRVEAVDRCLRGVPGSPDIELLLAKDAHDSLAAFVQQCFHILDPATPLEWGWYLGLVCDELELVTAGKTRDLLICMPPGFGKSLIVNVLWPAWWWLREPHKRFVSLSSDDDLALRSNRRMREVLESDWYQRLVARCAELYGTPVWGFARDQNRKEYYENTSRGHRQSFSVGGSFTGQRGDGVIVDDPHQVRDVLGDPVAVKATLDKTWNRVSQLGTRVYDRRVSWRVGIAQRFHDLDVPGRILKRNKGQTRTVILAMRFDPDCADNHPSDPRTEPGELLAPERMPQAEVDSLAAELDEVPGQASAQLDQRPIPPTGGLVKPHYLRPYDFDPQRPPTRWAFVITTIDATFKRTTKGSFVSISAWGIQGAKRFLLGEIHARMDYVELKEATRLSYAMWHANVTLVELKANGEALVRDLRDEIPGLVGVLPDPYGDKMTRAQVSMPCMAAGNVYVPSVEWMQTVNEWKAEMCLVPGTLVTTSDGDVPIEQVAPGDLVWTRLGWKRVLKAERTAEHADTMEVRAGDVSLRGTPNHPVWVEGRGFVPLGNIQAGDVLLCLPRSSPTEGSCFAGIPMPRPPRCEPTSSDGGVDERLLCTGSSTKKRSDPFRRGSTSTTSTRTHSTTASRTSNSSRAASTFADICSSTSSLPTCARPAAVSFRVAPTLEPFGAPSNAAMQLVESLTPSTRGAVSGAGQPSGPPSRNSDSAPIPAPCLSPGPTTERSGNVPASSAGSPSPDPSGRSAALERVVASLPLNVGRSPVYNLHVEDAEEYFANGILVHNCAFPFGADDRMDGWSQLHLWLADNEAMTRGNEEVYSALDAYLSELGG